MSPVLQRLGFPSVGDHRRFVTAIAVDAVGSGVFMPVCMLYFLVTTDLSLVQVGAAISVPGEREKWFGFLGALRNVGFALGGLLSGLAITIGTTTAYSAVVVANAASYVLAFVLLLAVPPTPRSEHRSPEGAWVVVLRDRPYRLLWATQLAFSTSMMALNFAMPVYATTVLGLPGWVTGAVFTINTVMVGFGQGLVVRAMTGAVRWLVLTNTVFGASFLIMLGASRLSIALATVVVLVGAVVYTAGEVLGGPVHGALSAEAAPEHLRGRYLSLIQLAWNLAGTISPVAFAWLLDRGTAPIWFGLTAVAAVGGLLAARLGTTLPQAAQRVTNRAEEPVAA